MIRNSKHSIKFANKRKLKIYQEFLSEYSRVGQIILNDIWENGYQDFSIQKEQYILPKFLDYSHFKLDTKLSARALSSLVTQVSGTIRAVCKKLYLGQKVSKPVVSFNPELSSKCIDIQQDTKTFSYFIKLKSTGFPIIKIPLKGTKISDKWSSGTLMTSVSLSKTYISLRFDVPNSLKSEGEIVGADTGIKTIVTFSNESTNNLVDNHLHSLDSITKQLSRKRKGSKAFRRKQEHRKNHINWFINKINFSNIKEIKLEKLFNIGFKKSKSRYLSHFCNTLIRDNIKRKAEEQEVLVTEQSSAYRSQRCSNCGLVRKANRTGKIYNCNSCKVMIDADLNAAKNHEIELPEIEMSFRIQRKNLGKGFYWNPTGYFVVGEDSRVPLSSK